MTKKLTKSAPAAINVAAHVIFKCGGPKIVAAWLDVDKSTVHRWTYPKGPNGRGGIIPAHYHSDILDRARLEGIDIAPSDFFQPSQCAVHSPHQERCTNGNASSIGVNDV